MVAQEVKKTQVQCTNGAGCTWTYTSQLFEAVWEGAIDGVVVILHVAYLGILTEFPERGGGEGDGEKKKREGKGKEGGQKPWSVTI